MRPVYRIMLTVGAAALVATAASAAYAQASVVARPRAAGTMRSRTASASPRPSARSMPTAAGARRAAAAPASRSRKRPRRANIRKAAAAIDRGGLNSNHQEAGRFSRPAFSFTSRCRPRSPAWRRRPAGRPPPCPCTAAPGRCRRRRRRSPSRARGRTGRRSSRSNNPYSCRCRRSPSWRRACTTIPISMIARLSAMARSRSSAADNCFCPSLRTWIVCGLGRGRRFLLARAEQGGGEQQSRDRSRA